MHDAHTQIYIRKIFTLRVLCMKKRYMHESVWKCCWHPVFLPFFFLFFFWSYFVELYKHNCIHHIRKCIEALSMLTSFTSYWYSNTFGMVFFVVAPKICAGKSPVCLRIYKEYGSKPNCNHFKILQLGFSACWTIPMDLLCTFILGSNADSLFLEFGWNLPPNSFFFNSYIWMLLAFVFGNNIFHKVTKLRQNFRLEMLSICLWKLFPLLNIKRFLYFKQKSFRFRFPKIAVTSALWIQAE